MSNWFTVKVKYTKTLEDGKLKRVSEAYLMSATNFTDAEARAHEEIGSTIRGEFNVVSISHTNIHDIFKNDNVDSWYTCKVTYEDMVGEKPKKVTQIYLAAGDSVKSADARVKEGLSGLMVDYNVISVVKSPILDVFEPASVIAKTKADLSV